MSLVVKRSDLYPVGTTVKAFSPPSNRHFGGKPSGVAVGEAVVDAAGTLTFAIPDGLYRLWASVGGSDVNLLAGSQGFTAPPTFLGSRIKAQREAAGAI